jgi:predicted phage-related endonuclease
VTTPNTITLGGSDVPAVLGLDPYLSAYALGCRKLGLTAAPPESEVMRNGLRLQSAHAAMLEDDGYQMIPAPAAGFTHPDLAWLVGHPDALVQIDLRPVPVELKLRGITPSESLRLRDSVQALMYAELLGASQALVSELHGGYGGIVREEWTVDRDDELIEAIVARCEVFLDGLRRGILPRPDGSDATREAIRERYADAEPGKAIRADPATWADVQAIRRLHEIERAASKQRAAYAQRVQDFMGDATELVSPFDTPAARWRPYDRVQTDVKRLRSEWPAAAADCLKVTTTRRFEANL